MIATGIAQYLHNRGVVTFDETGMSGNTFIAVMPSQPDVAVVLTRYAGEAGEVKYGYDSPGLQVRVRSIPYDPRPGEALAQQIYDELQDLHGVTLPNGIRLLRCSCLGSGPHPMGADSNGRMEYVLNFRTHYRRVTANRI